MLRGLSASIPMSRHSAAIHALGAAETVLLGRYETRATPGGR